MTFLRLLSAFCTIFYFIPCKPLDSIEFSDRFLGVTFCNMWTAQSDEEKTPVYEASTPQGSPSEQQAPIYEQKSQQNSINDIITSHQNKPERTKSTFNSKFDYFSFSPDVKNDGIIIKNIIDSNSKQTINQSFHYGHRTRINPGPYYGPNRSHKDISSLFTETNFAHYHPSYNNRHSLVLYPNYYHYNYNNTRVGMSRSQSYQLGNNRTAMDQRRPSIGSNSIPPHYSNSVIMEGGEETMTNHGSNGMLKPVRMMNTVSWIAIPPPGSTGGQYPLNMHPSQSFLIPSKFIIFFFHRKGCLPCKDLYSVLFKFEYDFFFCERLWQVKINTSFFKY